MNLFYEYVYPGCMLISMVSLLGAPFCGLFMSSIIGMSNSWCVIKSRLWPEKDEALRRFLGRTSISEFVESCANFVLDGIPVWALVITLVFAYGAIGHRENTRPIVDGTYAKVMVLENQFQVGTSHNRTQVGRFHVNLGYGITRIVTVENPGTIHSGDIILIGTEDGVNYFAEFKGKRIVPQPAVWL